MSDVWNDDRVQFARLLDELAGVGLEEDQIEAVAEAMDLPEERIHELFERAQRVFEQAKADLRPSHSRTILQTTSMGVMDVIYDALRKSTSLKVNDVTLDGTDDDCELILTLDDGEHKQDFLIQATDVDCGPDEPNDLISRLDSSERSDLCRQIEKLSPPDDGAWVIQNDRGECWSNTQGWVDFATADHFSEEDHDTFDCPTDGEWVPASEVKILDDEND